MALYTTLTRSVQVLLSKETNTKKSNVDLSVNLISIDSSVRQKIYSLIADYVSDYTNDLFSFKSTVKLESETLSIYEYLTLSFDSESIKFGFEFCINYNTIQELLYSITTSYEGYFKQINKVYSSIKPDIKDRIFITNEHYLVNLNTGYISNNIQNKLIIILNVDTKKSIISNLTADTVDDLIKIQTAFQNVFSIQYFKKVEFSNKTYYVVTDFDEYGKRYALEEEGAYCLEDNSIITSYSVDGKELIDKIVTKLALLTTN